VGIERASPRFLEPAPLDAKAEPIDWASESSEGRSVGIESASPRFWAPAPAEARAAATD
jgi:hypothetical protein